MKAIRYVEGFCQKKYESESVKKYDNIAQLLEKITLPPFIDKSKIDVRHLSDQDLGLLALIDKSNGKAISELYSHDATPSSIIEATIDGLSSSIKDYLVNKLGFTGVGDNDCMEITRSFLDCSADALPKFWSLCSKKIEENNRAKYAAAEQKLNSTNLPAYFDKSKFDIKLMTPQDIDIISLFNNELGNELRRLNEAKPAIEYDDVTNNIIIVMDKYLQKTLDLTAEDLRDFDGTLVSYFYGFTVPGRKSEDAAPCSTLDAYCLQMIKSFDVKKFRNEVFQPMYNNTFGKKEAKCRLDFLAKNGYIDFDNEKYITTRKGVEALIMSEFPNVSTATEALSNLIVGLLGNQEVTTKLVSLGLAVRENGNYIATSLGSLVL